MANWKDYEILEEKLNEETPQKLKQPKKKKDK